MRIKRLPSVDIDHEKAAFDAVNILIRSWHREIAMISGTLQDPANGFARFQGYKKALEDSGYSTIMMIMFGLVTIAMNPVWKQ